MFGTLQKRLPQELRLSGITTGAEANRFLEEVFSGFARPAEAAGSAFVAFAGSSVAGLADTLCVQEERVVSNDNTVRYKNRTRPTATATTTSRRMCGCTNTRTPPWPCSMGRAVWPATGPTAA